LQGALPRFEASNAQVLGVNIDSAYSHQAFAKSLGGITFPVLSDFHPHGAVTTRYGLWRPNKGYGRRAVFIVGRDGIVRWSRVYERGIPEVDDLLAALETPDLSGG